MLPIEYIRKHHLTEVLLTSDKAGVTEFADNLKIFERAIGEVETVLDIFKARAKRFYPNQAVAIEDTVTGYTVWMGDIRISIRPLHISKENKRFSYIVYNYRKQRPTKAIMVSSPIYYTASEAWDKAVSEIKLNEKL